MATIPSISMIPSGYKQNKVYSVLPTNGDGDLDFARTSVATRINENGLIEEMGTGVPRLDYSNGSCPSLLLEPQSTNLITYPLSFDNSYWTKSGATVAGGFSAPSVDNPTSAYKLVEDTSNGSHQCTFTLTSGYSIGDSLTFSFYVKKSERNSIIIYSQQLGKGVNFNLQNGSFGSDAFNNGYPENYESELVSENWYRISISGEVVSVVASSRIYLTTTDNNNSYQGDGTSGVYIFGAQMEKQPYATSLMLPSTEGSTVTRVADTASLVLPSGITSIIETIDGVEQAPITTIPTTYNVSLGNINQIKMY